MMSLLHYYIKFRKHRQSEIKRIVRSELVQNSVKQSALTLQESLVDDSKDAAELIVSLTTFGERIKTVYLAIESIAQQTLKPTKIILWLSEDDFSIGNLPITLHRLIKRGLTVNFRKDIGPHTKGLYAFKEFPHSPIVTIDDDIIYPIDLLESLYSKYLQHKNNVICNVGRDISMDINNNLLPYRDWKHISEFHSPSRTIMPLGVNGVLYPPNCFDEDNFDIKAMKETSPKADDIWFKMMALKNSRKTIVTGDYKDFTASFTVLDASFINALAVDNVIGGENKTQMKLVMERYNIHI